MLAIAGVLLIVAFVLDRFGVAGFRFGFAGVAVVLVGLAIGVGWWLLRSVPQRALWLVSLAVFAVVAAGLLVDRAPLSASRLRQAADEVELPFYPRASERSTGNGRCDPCPSFERTLRGPDLAVEAAVIEVGAALAEAGYPLRLTEQARRTGRFVTSDGTVDVAVAITRTGTGPTAVRLVFTNAS